MKKVYISPKLELVDLNFIGSILVNSFDQPEMEDFDVSEGEWN